MKETKKWLAHPQLGVAVSQVGSKRNGRETKKRWLTHSLVSRSQVDSRSTKASRPCPRFCTASKCRQPSVRSMAVHLDPARRAASNGCWAGCSTGLNGAQRGSNGAEWGSTACKRLQTGGRLNANASAPGVCRGSDDAPAREAVALAARQHRQRQWAAGHNSRQARRGRGRQRQAAASSSHWQPAASVTAAVTPHPQLCWR